MKPDPFKDVGFRRRLANLKREASAGKILDLVVWDTVKLSEAGVPWTFPFSYTVEGARVYEAFKWGQAPLFKVIVRLWPHYGHGRLICTRYKGGRFLIVETVEVLMEVKNRQKGGK